MCAYVSIFCLTGGTPCDAIVIGASPMTIRVYPQSGGCIAPATPPAMHLYLSENAARIVR